jgi:Glyoxalase-like domain
LRRFVISGKCAAMSAPTPIRPLDHLVLPVADLATARARLTSLGFTVAPDGVHPFGTANCCVYLADGTYLEPLAVADPDVAGAASRSGNVFTDRDRSYRRKFGENGFSAIVLSSGDAAADHQRFTDARLSAGLILEFSRPFVDAAGKRDTASFKLAFAAEPDQPDLFFFTCQRLHVPQIDRSALQKHANGVLGVSEILFCTEEPQAHLKILAEVTGVTPRTTGGRSFEGVAGKTRLGVRTPASLSKQFGVGAATGASLTAVGIVFAVAELSGVSALLQANAISASERTGRLIVPPAPGQGAAFIFEEVQ